MKTRIVAALAAVVLGATATVPALAFDGTAFGRSLPPTTFDGLTTSRGGLGVHDHPRYERCPASSAAEGNADQQTRPVKQYGQTAGGYDC